MKKLLVITHDTSLSGAPKSMVLLLEALKKNEYEIYTVALIGGGHLEQRFQNVSKKYYRLDQFSKKVDYPILKRIQNKIKSVDFESDYDVCIREIQSIHYDFIYANTIVSIPIAVSINSKIGTKLIAHIHELSTVINEFLPALTTYDSRIDQYVVPSFLNKNCLENDYNIPSGKINVIREASELQIIKADFTDSVKKHKKPSEIRILMCGGSYWRKGDDLFVLIANKVVTINPDYHFYWVGPISEERKRVNESDINKLNLVDNIHFIGETLDPEYWYATSDIFLLTSREDPFPLAAIEAGMAGLPILCFQNATGICEVINDAFTIPYLDLDLVVDKLLSFTSESNKFKEEGQKNKEFFSTCSSSSIGKEILEVLENINLKNDCR
jgi:glycosyltransferase involved in cell wall biosynthesis